MRLDRYTGNQPKFKVLRRQVSGHYTEVDPFEYFVLALKDVNTVMALEGYARSAANQGDGELCDDVNRLAHEASLRPDRKRPD